MDDYLNLPAEKITKLEQIPEKKRRPRKAAAKIRHLQKQQKTWLNSKIVYKKKK
jgi:hypothetical protein